MEQWMDVARDVALLVMSLCLIYQARYIQKMKDQLVKMVGVLEQGNDAMKALAESGFILNQWMQTVDRRLNLMTRKEIDEATANQERGDSPALPN